MLVSQTKPLAMPKIESLVPFIVRIKVIDKDTTERYRGQIWTCLNV